MKSIQCRKCGRNKFIGPHCEFCSQYSYEMADKIQQEDFEKREKK